MRRLRRRVARVLMALNWLVIVTVKDGRREIAEAWADR